MVQTGVTLHSAGISQCSNGSDGVAGTLVTDPTFAPLNQPLPLNFSLSVSGFANPGNFSADFLHSLDLPIGSDVFTLPAGFTANDVNGFIVNNRFAGAAVAVPEPSSAALLITGFAGLFGFRRRLGRTRA